MTQRIALITLLVPDYAAGIAFYVGTLGFALREDTRLSPDKRWVVVAPEGSDAALLLARATSPEQQAAIGNQTGGRVAIFLHTDDLAADLARYRQHGVAILREPVAQPYGTVAVIADPWGNLWDVIEPAS